MEELYQRQCGSRWELFCIKSNCWSNADGDQRVKKWCGKIVLALQMRQAEQLTTLNFTRENWRRASMKNITIIKPRENKRANKSSGGFKRKTVRINQSTWSPGKPVNRAYSPIPSVQAGCWKLYKDELRWKMGCYSDPHIIIINAFLMHQIPLWCMYEVQSTIHKTLEYTT